MSIEQRRFIRFSLDIPAIRQTDKGERQPIVLHQISIGGCLASWDDNIFTGEEFRILLRMANGNFLPLVCKALYKFAGRGIGARFVEITEFEQQLLAEIISQSLADEGLPLQVDPFAHPPNYLKRLMTEEERLTADRRVKEEEIVEQILSAEN